MATSREEEAIAEVRSRFPFGQRIRAIRRSKSGLVKEGIVQSVQVRTVDAGDGGGPKDHAVVIARFRNTAIVVSNPAGIEPIPASAEGKTP